ncbi:MAG: hypothetical protein A2846_02950 [Candidatus Doudnabacteria bacterium RIFCSPHIGHO2_01_FULL_49_9]|uniref:Uncharacterized protein n=1 Tax=Candidatus Doudnabacteria bacterium RIFCSPHIGHO2_01_FULL_49_9 TaxID=1817827 RepID=A0A1F5P353_9BACT|nr:MAG: hypothetical protein A2846_02950 [Candidatus Doudnabacteria bacterium RIFCSPHIGHO2_01_FULL_49_9]
MVKAEIGAAVGEQFTTFFPGPAFPASVNEPAPSGPFKTNTAIAFGAYLSLAAPSAIRRYVPHDFPL